MLTNDNVRFEQMAPLKNTITPDKSASIKNFLLFFTKTYAEGTH